MRYFLIGYKSSGKSTMGKMLANKLEFDFIDLDDVIEQREGKTIPLLYSEIGDKEFRIKEREALEKVVQHDNAVFALGGGAPCHFDNMSLIEKHGVVIYIKLDNDTLVERLKVATKDRPIVLNKSVEELHTYISDIRSKYEHFYIRAKYIVDGQDLTIERLLSAIEMEDYGKN